MFHLKRAAAADLGMVVDFEREVINETLYGKQLDHAASKSEIDTNEYYLYLRNGRLIATGALCQRENGSAYLSNIAVHPELRRQGVARAMVSHLLVLCDGATSVDLAVHPENHAARALYVSLGFSATQIRENFFGDGQPRMIMECGAVDTTTSI
jgi:ribosomal protein S18 acetylase RimI-like enzyme